jgi:hypothetical protein
MIAAFRIRECRREQALLLRPSLEFGAKRTSNALPLTIRFLPHGSAKHMPNPVRRARGMSWGVLRGGAASITRLYCDESDESVAVAVGNLSGIAIVTLPVAAHSVPRFTMV